MAAKDESKEVDLCCTVCLAEYNSPRLLPCSHTYCESCLEAILKQSRTKSIITCPQCRAQHQVPPGGPKAFLTDLTVTQDIETKKWHMKMANKKSRCGVCEHTGTTVSYCAQCEAFLCSYCTGAHKRMKVFSSHEIVPAVKYMEYKPIPKPVDCLIHPTHTVTFYCNTCNQLICNECVVGTDAANTSQMSRNHSSHKLYTLTTDSVKTIEAKLDEAVDEAKSQTDKIQSELQQLQELENSHEKHTEDLKEALSDSVESYIKALRIKCNEELSRINQDSTAALEAIQEQKKTLKKKAADLNASVRFAQKAKNCEDTIHKVAMMGQAIDSPPLKSILPAAVPIRQFVRPTVARNSLYTAKKEKKRLPSLDEPPLVVKNLESELKSGGLLQRYKGMNMSVQLLPIKSQLRGLFGGLSQHLGQQTKVSVTFSVKPIGQPEFRIIYGGSNFSKELPFSCTVDSTAWVLTLTPCCNGTHKVHVKIYGRWVTENAPTFDVTGELKEGDLVRRTPNSKSKVADLFEDREDNELSDYEVGKLTKVEKSYLGKGCTMNYKVEVTWGHNKKEPKVEDLSFIWSEYSGFPLELAIPTPLPRSSANPFGSSTLQSSSVGSMQLDSAIGPRSSGGGPSLFGGSRLASHTTKSELSGNAENLGSSVTSSSLGATPQVSTGGGPVFGLGPSFGQSAAFDFPPQMSTGNPFGGSNLTFGNLAKQQSTGGRGRGGATGLGSGTNSGSLGGSSFNQWK